MDLLAWSHPPRCGACDRRLPRRTPLCEGCATSLYPLGVACPRCAEPLESPVALLCRRCQRAPLPLASITAPWRFGGELATVLRRLKFAGRSDLARSLAPLFRDDLIEAAGQADLIVPVPLHWTRRLSRGYDQAALLAAAAGRLPVRIEGQVLRRRRRTAAQTGQSARAREENLR